MAQPMLKEDPVRRETARRMDDEALAGARALERRLGRPLRDDIDDPMSEDDEREMLLARLAYGERRPASELLKKYGRQ